MRDRSVLVGSLTVVAAAAGFGMLGVLARTAYSIGLDPVAFVAWRAAFATLVVVAFAAWRISRGRAFVAPWRIPVRARAALDDRLRQRPRPEPRDVLRVRPDDRRHRAARLLHVSGVRGRRSRWPAGTSRSTAIRVGALGLSLAGMVLVVAGSLTADEAIRIAPLGIALALVAALSQTVFMTVSRAGYPQVPTEQAAGWILATTMIACVVLATLGGGVEPLTLPLTEPSALALLAFTGIARRRHPDRPVPDRDPGDRRNADGDPHAVRARRRRRSCRRRCSTNRFGRSRRSAALRSSAAALLLQRAPAGTLATGRNPAALPGTVER